MDLRRIVLEQSFRAGVGHIGSALSVADILCALYGGVLRIPSPRDPERDRFILSKGHAALALYGALHLAGFLSESELNTFATCRTRLGVHPDHGLPGVDFSTGSLGQGLSMGTGAALAARMQGSDRRVFVLLSDAECNEGATWEAVMFAAHHRLGHLTAIIDNNRQQALGATADVLGLEPMGERWGAFGWSVSSIDGHDVEALRRHLVDRDVHGAPHVVIANTTFGKGVSFMERQLKWHYWPLNADEFASAMSELA